MSRATRFDMRPVAICSDLRLYRVAAIPGDREFYIRAASRRDVHQTIADRHAILSARDAAFSPRPRQVTPL